MITKVRAKVESRDIKGDRVTLVFETPYFCNLSPEDDVFVELQTLQGTRVEFHIPEVIVPIEPIEDVTDLPITNGADEPSSDPVEPIEKVKSYKKK